MHQRYVVAPQTVVIPKQQIEVVPVGDLERVTSNG